MTLIDLLKKWLVDRQKHYSVGLELFDKLATQTIKARHGGYLHEVDDCSPYDHHMLTLINQLARIKDNYNINPSVYPTAAMEIEGPVYMTDDEKCRSAEKKRAQIDSLTEDNLNLNERISSLELSGSDNSEGIAQLQEQMDENLDEIQQLRKEVDELMKPGVKVVAYENMPPFIRRAYDRIREIVPSFADLHHDLSADISDDERKTLALRLCRLDDERRRLWASINAWSEGRSYNIEEIKRPVLEQKDSVVKGLQMARRLRQVHDNLGKSRRTLAKYIADGNDKARVKTEKRIAKYEEELSQLERAISHQEEKHEQDNQ